MKFNKSLKRKTKLLLNHCRKKSLRLTTAESCTGGLVSACLTAIPGSSDVVEGGFVTYSNHSKKVLLGVPANMLEAHGAVSEEVARAMAEGAVQLTEANLSVAITGVAGPGGGSVDKPVGLVYLGVAGVNRTSQQSQFFFQGDREKIRSDSVEAAIDLLLTFVTDPF